MYVCVLNSGVFNPLSITDNATIVEVFCDQNGNDDLDSLLVVGKSMILSAI